jgi:protein-S-isoprenylcysteine O-methyltransferase Ste14
MRIVAIAFAFLYFVGALLYVLLPSWIAFLAVALPGWFRLLMVGVAALGLGFISLALRGLGRNWAPSMSGVKKDAFLVSTGPYAIVRHPIYLGAFVLLAALSLVAANLLLLLPTIVLLALLYMQIGGEEASLIEKFGDEYREYMKRTPRFIPKFRQEHSTQPGNAAK